jgi:hypothetical protein
MKTQLAKAGQEPSPWQNIKVTFNFLGLNVKISPLVDDTLDSQSSLSQLQAANVNLVGVALYALEGKIAEELLRMGFIKNGKVKEINPDKLTVMQKGNNYFALLQKELDFLLANTNGGNGKKFKLIKKMSEYNKNDTNTIHGILVIEGLHGLLNDPSASNAKQTFIKNLDAFTAKHRLFAANITHLQNMPLANHAFGMQFLNKTSFYPTGNGITPLGVELIKVLYSKNILIDIKHMGLWSRIGLYIIRNNENINLPIICTHAGITGISKDEKLHYLFEKPIKRNGVVWETVFYKKRGLVPNSAFNLSSINLYNEDIIEILKSKGLIGISLDKRIIGFPAVDASYSQGTYPSDLEYISIQEEKIFFDNHIVTKLERMEEDENRFMTSDEAETQTQTTMLEVHPYYFWNQVIQILKVAKDNPTKGLTVADASKRICLGSDFDGLINPIDCCKNVTDYNSFKQILKNVASPKSFWTNTGFAKGELDVDVLVEGIFFNNADAFMQKNYV